MITKQSNFTADTLPKERCLHQLFEEQVARTPDRVALIYEEQQLTYAQLEACSNQLAHFLQQLGVGPEIRVALCLPRSLDMIIGILAILKAGGAYVPLDPGYPPERLSFILEDASVTIVLTQTRIQALLQLSAARVVCLDEVWPRLHDYSEEKPACQATWLNLAYIIYTSGSTGQPKGVLLAHRGLALLVEVQKRTFGSNLEERVLQFASLSFDAAVWEIVLALPFGRVLVLASQEALLVGSTLLSVLQQQQISMATLPPSVLATIPIIKERLALRLLISAGEACTAELVARWAADYTFFNGYGPTEATVCATLHKCAADQQTPPIGHPIPWQQLYVLDSSMQPVPVGAEGELYLSGPSLARGYLNRADLTAERFVPHPFSTLPGERLYRTGDLVRYRSDGNLVYVGRADQQVKLRGYRIELGEIEEVLMRHPAVREAAALVREQSAGNQQLVAYIVPAAAPATLTVDTLMQHMQKRLPAYMVPSRIVLLEKFPLMSSGKLDRRALPSPDETPVWPVLSASESASIVEAEYIPPLTPVEEMVSAIWKQVLGLKEVDTHDNFFALGGHSLSATQVISRINEAFNIELPVDYLFEVSTIAELAVQIEAIHRQARGEVAALCKRDAALNEDLPLSFAQQRLWFLDQLVPGNPFYNTPLTLLLQGRLHLTALEQSLSEIVARHEVLRTSYPAVEGRPIQHINAPSRFPLAVVDLCALSASERERQARAIIALEANRPFHLSRGPLIRALLIRLDAQKYVLLLALHHIVLDGWSIGVLVREVATLYAAFATAQPLPPPLPVQYADYALWQRTWLRGTILEQQLAYWRRQLTNVPVLDLPTDYARPAVQSYRGASQSFLLKKSALEELLHFSQQQGCTLFMTLLAAFQILLARYSGQKDIVVGTPIANRSHPDLEALIGCFVNTLVLRTDLSGNPTGKEVMQRVRKMCLEAYMHQDLPFERLVEELQLERDMSRSPIVQVLLVLHNAPMSLPQPPDLQVQLLEKGAGHLSAKVDLTLSLSESPDGLAGTIEYCTDLFEASTISRMVGHWQTLLEGIVAHPEERIAELPLLTSSERTLLLEQWNTTRSFPQNRCLHHVFEAQAERSPDAVALVHEQMQLTYGELNQRANRLAHHLQSLGVGPEMRVGLCLERSLELVIGLLAILKAGGAYVPLDPHYPAERLTFLVTDSQASLLLTQESLLPRVARTGVPVCTMEQWNLLSDEATTAPVVECRGEQIAYIIYTSGSTGQPKGVLIPHANVLRLFASTQAWSHFGPQDTWTLSHSIAFDFSVWELWGALLYGGRLVLVPYLVSRSPGEMHQLLVTQQVTIFNQTPSAFAQWQKEERDRNDDPRLALRYIFFGGEALEMRGLQSWWERHEERRPQLVNMYGITETTVHVTEAQLSRADLQESRGSRIGRPLPDLQVYVLDNAQQPVPIGIPGELYVGGAGLARGYLNRPEITAERFIPHPFSQQPGSRLYRTGDLVRYLEDGNLEYLGRTDLQVKIRGYRIELEEIEAVLAQCPIVREAVVLAREDTPGERRLVAYIVPVAEPPTTYQLRDFLQQRLPDYMLPAAFVIVERFPLTTNGKVDRHALPAPDMNRPDLENRYVAAQTPVQQRLVAIWQQVLGLEQVGIQDNFFALGGHSLLATQALALLRTAFAIELPLRTFFETPTIAALAEQIVAAQQRQQGTALPQATGISRHNVARAPLSFEQRRFWFMDQWEPESPLYNVPLAIRLVGPLAVETLAHSLQTIVERHETLRTTFVAGDRLPEQNIIPHMPAVLPLIDLSALPAEKRSHACDGLIRQHAFQPFDLAQGPLWRIDLLRLAEQEHVLLLTLHHIITDGRSTEVLLHEISEIYTKAVRRQQALLPILPIQYADYALWQQEQKLDQQLKYWKEQLQGIPELITLPTDHPRPPVQSYHGAGEQTRLSRELLAGLQRLSQREGVTLFMILLAAFQTLLAYYNGQDDIVVGTPVANRPFPELEGLIGCFINTLVMRLNTSGDPSLQEIQQRVRKLCLEAYTHQDLPFEKLVQEMHIQRTMHHLPLFQVWFVLFDETLTAVTLPGITASVVERDRSLTRYDLKLEITRLVNGQIDVVFEYNTDLFEQATIQRMSNLFSTLLQITLEHGDWPMSRAFARLAETEHYLKRQEEQLLSAYSARTLKHVTRKGRLFDLS